MHPVTDTLAKHYSKKFALYGSSPEGVDWGADESNVLLRYDKMLGVTDNLQGQNPSLLDVGCGYGGLRQHALRRKIALDYTGIDVAGNMIEWAKANMVSGIFIHSDILDYEFQRTFDYVVCNGILTQKLETTSLEMDRFAAQIIRRLFSLCTVGIAFNVMTTKVNYYANNLYYRNPAELLAWCISEISPHLRLDHSYRLYEYTIYIYRNPV